jgi:hypothetical protein
MKIVLTVGLVLIWIAVMQANLGWIGSETAKLQVDKGLSADEAWRRVIWRTALFALMYTGAAIFFGWKIWR